MKLYFANTSPYARKARVVLSEKGLEDRVDAVFQNPFEDSPELTAANPLKRVPALLTDEGRAIFDSPVICAFLDDIGDGPSLIPGDASRWSVLTGEAMTDGILDAAFAIVMERRRDEPQRSEMWLGRWSDAIDRTLDTVEQNLSPFKGDITLTQIGLGCALGYLDFRLPDLAWRPNRPSLEAWYEAFAQRPSMQSTVPPAG